MPEQIQPDPPLTGAEKEKLTSFNLRNTRFAIRLIFCDRDPEITELLTTNFLLRIGALFKDNPQLVAAEIYDEFDLEHPIQRRTRRAELICDKFSKS